jgi:purine-binding chemotaxis protein CheW
MEKSTFLTFVLGQELFAVNVLNVLEVLEQQQITPVPQTPAHILGIINFRGEILPVVDTRYKFNLPAKSDILKNFVIVYVLYNEDQRISVAATADAVKDVIEISPDEIKPVPEMGITYDSQYISGVLKRDELFIMILNTEKVFSITNADQILQTELQTEL